MRLRPTHSDADGPLAAEPEGKRPAQPPPPDLEQRRFDLKMIGLMLVLAAVLVGGLFVYLHFHDRAVARARARADAAAQAAAAQAEADQKVADVKEAYLDYSAALTRMEQQVSLTPLEPYLTAAGLQDEQSEFQEIQNSGYHYLLEFSSHDIQAVVYAGGQLASVDDVLVERMTPLDPSTMAPAGNVLIRPGHGSYALKLQGGRWLVDSVVTFGSDGSDPRLGLSYAATNRDRPLSQDVRAPIETAYLAFWQTIEQAFHNLDPTPLRKTVLPPALDTELSSLNSHVQEHIGFSVRDEHNYRVALKDPGTAYVYDTLADSSFDFDMVTKQPVTIPLTTIYPEKIELKKVGGQWKVDLVLVETSR